MVKMKPKTKKKPSKKKAATKKPTPNKKRPTVPEVIALLENEKFLEDTRKVHSLTTQFFESHYYGEEWKIPGAEISDENRTLFEEIGKAFVSKWGIFPPPYSELLDPHPKRAQGDAIITGNWGIIPVFPWTTVKEIQEEARRIRRAIDKRHLDTIDNERRDMIARWLWLHRRADGSQFFSNTEIARHVWGRKTGLRRPTKAEAIARLDPVEEEALFRQFRQLYMEQGVEERDARRQAERRVYRRARGPEAPAAAAVRQALRRDMKRREAFQRDYEIPQPRDPISYALTMLIRTIIFGPKDEEEIGQRLLALHEAIRDYPPVT